MQRLILLVALGQASLTVSLRGQAASVSLQRQVFAAESSFAASMVRRDLDAFAAAVSPEAIFFGDTTVMRGKAKVVEGVAPPLRGAGPVLLEARRDRGAPFRQPRHQQRPGL